MDLDISKEIAFVAFESKNLITNLDQEPILKETGLVAVWSAGMFKGSDESTVIIPLNLNAESETIYKYMGKLERDRLQIKSDILFFKADGLYRSKIGIPPNIAPAIYGCYAKDKKDLQLFNTKRVGIVYTLIPPLLYRKIHIMERSYPFTIMVQRIIVLLKKRVSLNWNQLLL